MFQTKTFLVKKHIVQLGFKLNTKIALSHPPTHQELLDQFQASWEAKIWYVAQSKDQDQKTRTKGPGPKDRYQRTRNKGPETKDWEQRTENKELEPKN